jgi:hypothetical protein
VLFNLVGVCVMKSLVVFLVFFVSFINVFAEEEMSKDAYWEIRAMISIDLEDNMDRISQKSKFLSDSMKYSIYDEHSKSGAGPFFLNLFGFGIGSFYQGDYRSGLFGALGNGLGIVMIIEHKNVNGLGPIGGGIFMVTYVVNLFSPWFYASSYNSKLELALRIDESTKIRIAPDYDYSYDNTMIYGASISITF